ncbi:MAG: BppU family phage baseplate upper protein, partial [Lachnospiraceae bacterium]|nr:BppU family phage baseplate upper protein [Lachnospiraceae bacterium]
MQILTPIVIDLMNPDPLPIINAKQGDTGRGIRVTVTTDGQICQCASEEVNIFIRKPDGKLIYNGCDIQGGDVVVMFTSQALAVHGQLQVELEILSGEKKVSTPIAVINVLPTNINAEAIESTNEFNRYETIITEMEASEAERSEAEDKRVAAEAARAEAESERSEAEGDRAAAETERISAETERMKAEALRTQAEALRRQAEEARAAAEELREAAKLTMQQATEAANAAAEAAGAYVLGDISGKTVTFTEAVERANIESEESTATIFGKIKKWFSDLKDAAFASIANNLTTTSAGSVLDARQGKVLSDQLTELNGNLPTVANNLTTTGAGSVLDARQGKILNDKLSVTKNDIRIYPCDFSGDTLLNFYKSNPKLLGCFIIGTNVPTDAPANKEGY